MFWAAVSVGIIVAGLLIALAMREAATVALRKSEAAERAAERSHAETQKLFDADLERQQLRANAEFKQQSNIGAAEAEVARKQRAEVEYRTEQTKLAIAFVNKIGTPEGELLMKGHNLEVAELLRAITRELEGVSPTPGRKAS